LSNDTAPFDRHSPELVIALKVVLETSRPPRCSAARWGRSELLSRQPGVYAGDSDWERATIICVELLKGEEAGLVAVWRCCEAVGKWEKRN